MFLLTLLSIGLFSTSFANTVYKTAEVLPEGDSWPVFNLTKQESKNMQIKPTVGRVVWYYPSKNDPGVQLPGQPHAASVAAVHNDSCVNLSIVDSNGVSYSKTSVLLYQGDGPKPDSDYAEWMPYQVGQAKKHDTSVAGLAEEAG